jgi:hypothetical protein
VIATAIITTAAAATTNSYSNKQGECQSDRKRDGEASSLHHRLSSPAISAADAKTRKRRRRRRRRRRRSKRK